jgi:hypothetical protein
VGSYLSKLILSFSALVKIAARAICDGANIKLTLVASDLSKKSSAAFRNFSTLVPSYQRPSFLLGHSYQI